MNRTDKTRNGICHMAVSARFFSLFTAHSALLTSSFPLFPRTPHFPALRPCRELAQRPSTQNQFPSSKYGLLGILVIGLHLLLASFVVGKDVKVFLLGGQSNMDGCGRSNELPAELRQLPENVRIWDIRENKWSAIGEDSIAIKRNHQFGPELLFAHRLSKAFPDHDIALIKTSAGGTKLQNHWLPGMKTYDRFIRNYQNSVADLERSGRRFEVCGMLWMQGEGDSEAVELANAYERNLKTMLADVRQKTGKPRLPFVMGRISSSLLKKTPWNFEHSPIVRKAQEAVAAADPDTAIIDTDKLTTQSDNTHFDTAGQILLGEAMAARMLELLTKAGAPQP